MSQPVCAITFETMEGRRVYTELVAALGKWDAFMISGNYSILPSDEDVSWVKALVADAYGVFPWMSEHSALALAKKIAESFERMDQEKTYTADQMTLSIHRPATADFLPPAHTCRFVPQPDAERETTSILTFMRVSTANALYQAASARVAPKTDSAPDEAGALICHERVHEHATDEKQMKNESTQHELYSPRRWNPPRQVRA